MDSASLFFFWQVLENNPEKKTLNRKVVALEAFANHKIPKTSPVLENDVL